MENEGKDWQQRIEHQRLSDKLEDLSDRLRELEITLLGKRAKQGLIAEYDRHDRELTRINAILFQDPTGQKGLLHDVDVLMGRRKAGQEYNTETRRSWTAIIVALITLVGTIATNVVVNWDKIAAKFPKYKPDPLHQMIEKAKRPKSQKKIYRRRVIKPISDNGVETPPKAENHGT